jgi:hypothetical protein
LNKRRYKNNNIQFKTKIQIQAQNKTNHTKCVHSSQPASNVTTYPTISETLPVGAWRSALIGIHIVGLWSGRKRRFILMSGVESVVGRGMRRVWEVGRMERMGMEREMAEMGRGIERGAVRKVMEAEAGG